MSARLEQTRRRVLVALDASRSSLDALTAAAALAARLGAELHGLFVEDVNLLRAAGLPFASQLSSLSGASQPLERRALERELRALADAARASLAEEARRVEVTWSFRVARGQVSVEVLSAAGEADLLVLGRTGRRVVRGPGETARTAVSRAPSSVLVVGPGAGLGRPVLAAYDGSPGAERVLELAARLYSGTGRITLLVCAETPAQARTLIERARRGLERAGGTEARCLVVGGRQELVRAVRSSGAVLVLGASNPALGDEGLEALLQEVDSPVLVVR